MSLAECIHRAVAAGQLNDKLAAVAQDLLAERIEAHAHLGAGAEAAAAEDVWVMLRQDFQRRRRGNLLQMQKNHDLVDQITRHRDQRGEANAADFLRNVIEWQQSGKSGSIRSIQDALTNQYYRAISDFLATNKRNVLTGSSRSKALMSEIVRELHGEATGNARAKEMADALASAMEMARLDFNAAGGDIAKLDGWALAHKWDRRLVRRLGKTRDEQFTAWRDIVEPELDWARINDFHTGKPFKGSSPEARETFLNTVFDKISTDGWSTREPAGMKPGQSMAKRHTDHRVLHFRNAEAWMRVNKQFGRDDPFAAVLNHLDTMARDTAHMRVLGPNPNAGFELLSQTAAKLAQERPWKPKRRVLGPRYTEAKDEVTASVASARRMLDITSGAASVAEDQMLASVASGTRHFLVASQLGGAMLSAVSDIGFQGMAARHVGMDPKRVIGRQLKMIARSKDRGLAVRTGIIAESAANTGVAQARLMGDAYGPAVMERLSEFTMRASGLTAWTDIGRGAFRLEFYGFLADNAKHSWDDLPPPLRELVFEARGITPKDWDIIRSTDLFRDAAEPDAAFLIPSDIRYRGDIDADRAMDLSLKLDAAIFEQMEFAIPATSIRGRAAMMMGAPGSFGGELMRSGLMYKSFALSLMFNQVGRILFNKVNGNRVGNILMFGTLTTLMGAFSLQLKDLAKGRDPRPMNNGEFIMAAALQGGGLGIFGDFLYASQNRFGGGMAVTLAGPGVGFVNDTAQLGGSLTSALLSDDPRASDKAGRAAVKYLNRYSGPTNLWYANLALDRLLFDTLQEVFDQDATRAFRRTEANRKRLYGSEAWYPSGSRLPERTPAFDAVLQGDTP